jgi:uncharacterized protein (TIGR00369 family)
MGGPFIANNGPLFGRLRDGRLQLGFRVEARHTNPLNICHGGMLASFADMLLPCIALYQGDADRRFLPTISLQIDFLAPAALGAWVQGEGEVLRRTRNMIFVQALVHAEGNTVLRVSGIFKQGPAIGENAASDPFGLRG